MATLYTDHNVALRTAHLLRWRGYDVVTARDLHLERASHARQLLTAATYGRILITHNVNDFTLLHEAWQMWSGAWGVQPVHGGILLIPHRWQPADAAHHVDAFLHMHPLLVSRLCEWRGGSWVFR